MPAQSVSRFWRDQIAHYALIVRDCMCTAQSAVAAIYINQAKDSYLGDGTVAENAQVAESMVPGLTRYHRGAWPLALDLYEQGWIASVQVTMVRDALLDSAGLWPDENYGARPTVASPMTSAACSSLPTKKVSGSSYPNPRS